MPERIVPSQSERQYRIAEITRQLAEIDAHRAPLAEERARLITEQARQDWPDGPFRLHYWIRGVQDFDEYDTPLEAVQVARAMEDYGDSAPTNITDIHGTEIYSVAGFMYERVADGYPDVPDGL